MGVTLLEMMVAMTTAGVTLGGLMVLFASATGDFVTLSRLRETRHSQGLFESEMMWRLRAVPPEGFRQTQAEWDQAVISFPEGAATTTATCLTYDYSRGHVGASLSSQGFDDRTGIVFRYLSVVYRFEGPRATMTPKPSFNQFSKDELQSWCTTPANLALCEILAVGVSHLAIERVPLAPGGVSARWTLFMR